eukprot:Skav229070  [mRNA]  locus=scaffold2781:66088:78189:+ [translate_table: standard]
MPHCRPMLTPVVVLSPVQITHVTPPSFKSSMTCLLSAFISLRKNKRPQILRPCSKESRVMSDSPEASSSSFQLIART